MDDIDAYYDDPGYPSLQMVDCQSLGLFSTVNIEATATATDVSLASAGFAEQQDDRDPSLGGPLATRSRDNKPAAPNSKFVLDGFELPQESVQRQKRVVRRFVTEEERRLRRRATNREAARRTRQRKQHLIVQMESEISRMERENELLEERVSALASENVSLLAHMAQMGKDSQLVTRENAALQSEYQHLRGITGVSPKCENDTGGIGFDLQVAGAGDGPRSTGF